MTWDDETCLRFAEAYDREDAAQRGEPSPHADKGEGYAEWAADRVACVRAGLSAAPAVPDDVAQLRSALRDALAWIDAVPPDTPLPTMPGFDRDAVNALLEAHTAAQPAPDAVAEADDLDTNFPHPPTRMCRCRHCGAAPEDRLSGKATHYCPLCGGMSPKGSRT